MYGTASITHKAMVARGETDMEMDIRSCGHQLEFPLARALRIQLFLDWAAQLHYVEHCKVSARRTQPSIRSTVSAKGATA